MGELHFDRYTPGRSIRDESGLYFPDTVAEVEECITHGVYLLPHHLSNIIQVTIDLGGTEHGAYLEHGASDWLQEVIYADDRDAVDRQIIRNIHPQLDVNHVDDIGHTYGEDISGDTDAIAAMANVLVDQLAEQEVITIGMDNSRDAICQAMNVGAIGHHCHLAWLESKYRTRHPGKFDMGDTTSLLNMLQWIVFAHQLKPSEQILKDLWFLNAIRDGYAVINIGQGYAHGREFVLPEIQIHREFFNTGNPELVEIDEVFMDHNYSLRSVAELYGVSRTPLIAQRIYNNLTLNNFQDFI